MSNDRSEIGSRREHAQVEKFLDLGLGGSQSEKACLDLGRRGQQAHAAVFRVEGRSLIPTKEPRGLGT